jgi:hemolysin III
MGWLALFFIYPLYQALPGEGMWLLLMGGLCYTLGVLFYVAKKIKYTHAIWHVFVTGGCASHFFLIYYYVV